MKIFPIVVPCSEQGFGAHAFNKIFLAKKPEDMIWHGYDSVIHSRTDVEFFVFDMLDNCRGGVGKEIARFKAVVPESTTEKFIERRIMDLAMEKRTIEIIAAEGEIVKRYADEIRAAMGRHQ